MDTTNAKTPQETLFEFIGGHVCLDFTNTVGEMPRGQHERDDLTRYTDLVSWSQQANLVTENEAEVLRRKAACNEGEALAVLRRAHTLREAIYHIFTALIAGQQPVGSDLETLNKELRKGTTGASLVLTQGSFEWKWEKEETALDSMLGPIARSAATLLTSDERTLVRQCANPRCEWLFVDTTKNHRRQWCRTTVCGNCVRVRRYRQRQHDGSKSQTEE